MDIRRNLSFQAEQIRHEAKARRVAVLLGTGGGSDAVLLGLDAERVSIGRDFERTIVLPDNTVSGYHADLRRYGRRWVLDDLSRNGTVLRRDGETRAIRVHHDRVDLHHGDYLRLASSQWLLYESYDPSPTATIGAAVVLDPVSLDTLSAGERRVLQAYVRYWLEHEQMASLKQLAAAMNLGESTIKTHLSRIRREWGCAKTAELLERARDAGFLP